jgi:hypothetical protein
MSVSAHSFQHEDIEAIENLSKALLSQLEEFLISYNKQRGKKFKINGTGDPKKAVAFLKAGIKDARTRSHPEGSCQARRLRGFADKITGAAGFLHFFWLRPFPRSFEAPPRYPPLPAGGGDISRLAREAMVSLTLLAGCLKPILRNPTNRF